ncbi:MAG TPA: hypothetical protein VGK20_12490 [Candidatus Binatia bacterium]|jgi:hypothetical protein
MNITKYGTVSIVAAAGILAMLAAPSVGLAEDKRRHSHDFLASIARLEARAR